MRWDMAKKQKRPPGVYIKAPSGVTSANQVPKAQRGPGYLHGKKEERFGVRWQVI